MVEDAKGESGGRLSDVFGLCPFIRAPPKPLGLSRGVTVPSYGCELYEELWRTPTLLNGHGSLHRFLHFLEARPYVSISSSHLASTNPLLQLCAR